MGGERDDMYSDILIYSSTLIKLLASYINFENSMNSSHIDDDAVVCLARENSCV